jgi:hypothetical protein
MTTKHSLLSSTLANSFVRPPNWDKARGKKFRGSLPFPPSRGNFVPALPPQSRATCLSFERTALLPYHTTAFPVTNTTMALPQTVPSMHFYGQFHGHPLEHLEALHNALTQQGIQRRVWLAGDSSMDNKHWVRARVSAVHGYEHILDPPTSRPDVCYWLNCVLPEDRVAINCAVEATSVGERMGSGGELLHQDEFLRDHLRADDALIVSVGGNDFALKPTLGTVLHMFMLVIAMFFTPTCLLNAMLRCHPSFWAIVRIVRNQVTAYVAQLTARLRPNERARVHVLICMIYFPCTKIDAMSWAGKLLQLTGYDRNPVPIQHLIRALYRYGTCRIPDVTPVPLFDVLDADNLTHYIARVEPSSEGGRLMANHLWRLIKYTDC